MQATASGSAGLRPAAGPAAAAAAGPAAAAGTGPGTGTGAGPGTGTGPGSRPALAEDLYALVTYLHKAYAADLFAAMGTLELTITQIKLLHQLEGSERELTLKEAAERVPLSLAAASRTVDDLVRRGFVQRHEDIADRRMKRVSVTEGGRSVIRRLNEARRNGLEQFTQTLTEDERGALAQALEKLLVRPDIAVCRPEGI